MNLADMVTGAAGEVQAQGNTVIVPPDGQVTITNLGNTAITVRQNISIEVYEDRGIIGVGAFKGEWQFKETVYESKGNKVITPGQTLSVAGRTWKVKPGTFKYEQLKKQSWVLECISGLGAADPFTDSTRTTKSPHMTTVPSTTGAMDDWSIITTIIISLLIGAGGGYMLKGKLVQNALGTGTGTFA